MLVYIISLRKISLDGVDAIAICINYDLNGCNKKKKEEQKKLDGTFLPSTYILKYVLQCL